MSRIANIVVSCLFIVILSPLFVLIALFIKLESKGPIFFKQQRVGRHEKPFFLLKFRSMYLHTESPVQLGPIKHNHQLVTPFGFFIRRFKLDEIPQFINVLRGELSLIGPRPCLFSTLENMSVEQKRRFHVLPGLTGWAEVNGNVELTWHEQLTLDLWYVDHRSFLLDCKIFFKTLITVVFGSVRNSTEIKKASDYINCLNKKMDLI